jgi:hypothetical protein
MEPTQTLKPIQADRDAAARPLRWYKPTDHPQDSEDALWMAHGIGGRYSIQEDLDKFIVWLADDEFRFITCESVGECKATAEEHWQKAVAAVLRSPKERGEANCRVPPAVADRIEHTRADSNRELVEALRQIAQLPITPIADKNAGAQNGKALIQARSFCRAALEKVGLPLTRTEAQPTQSAEMAAWVAIDAVYLAKFPRERWSSGRDDSGIALTLQRQQHWIGDAVKAALASIPHSTEVHSDSKLADELDRYDAGLFGDGGGGNVEWWWDYLRAELDRAHDFYSDQFAALRAPSPLMGEEVVERLKIAFEASLTNANARMKYLDHDSMDEIIEAAWVGFEEPALATLSPQRPDEEVSQP